MRENRGGGGCIVSSMRAYQDALHRHEKKHSERMRA
jgi:hypothetical protein